MSLYEKCAASHRFGNKLTIWTQSKFPNEKVKATKEEKKKSVLRKPEIGPQSELNFIER